MSADEHGNDSTYSNHNCRCDRCKDAHTRAIRKVRLRRQLLLRVVDGREVTTGKVRHGRASTYTNWYCRCEPCTAAQRAHSRAYYLRQRAS